jgi:hypothetical protein
MFMPKNNRRVSANSPAPLITFDEVAAEKESFRLSWTVLANIREYAAYVKDVTGKETTPDEVADKALKRLFDADKGFRQWLQKKNGEGKVRAKRERADKPMADGKAGASSEPPAKSQM